MRSHKTIRTLSVVASAALILGAFVAGPADAKKKKKKPPVPAGCAAYTPSEWGAELPVNVVTDEHTAEAPLVLTVPTEMGFGSSSPQTPDNVSEDNPVSHAFANVQVDSANPEIGLYGRLEFSDQWDYDLYFRGNDGVGIAYSAGVSPFVTAFGFDGTGHGGQTEIGAENINGLTSADCVGYLVDIVSSTTIGEDTTLKLWLGEAQYTPEG
ncbi:MAG TPA: hypothetical protein VG318_10980 [Actinomycetota bacterium]|nr:hypothetical protein [Actinomycetota bacterium]